VLDAVKHGMKREFGKNMKEAATGRIPANNLALKHLSLNGDSAVGTS
jgi:hypothetical protein